jgi:hypothetical protein
VSAGRTDLHGRFACRLCRHDQYDHNLMVGCPNCWCMATPNEASPRSDREDSFSILPPGQYLPGYTPRPPRPVADCPIRTVIIDVYADGRTVVR